MTLYPTTTCATSGCKMSFLKEPALRSGRSIDKKIYCKRCFATFGNTQNREQKANLERIKAVRNVLTEPARTLKYEDTMLLFEN